jgi:hypothetical protein
MNHNLPALEIPFMSSQPNIIDPQANAVDNEPKDVAIASQFGAEAVAGPTQDFEAASTILPHASTAIDGAVSADFKTAPVFIMFSWQN